MTKKEMQILEMKQEIKFERANREMIEAGLMLVSNTLTERTKELETIQALLYEVYYSPEMKISDETFNKIENYILTK